MRILCRITFLSLLAALLAGAAETTPATTPQTRRDQRQERKSSVRPTRWVNPLRAAVPGAEHRTFRSAAMKCDVGFVIYTPPGYAEGTQRLPVIYWLHGRGANESSGTVAVQALHELTAAKKVPPMMMVCPNGGDSSFYCDSPDGTVMAETAFIKELIPFVDKNYRTIAAREGRALEGFSMGGFGVMKLGAKYPQMFCSLLTYGGALVEERTMPVRHSGTFTLMFGGKAENFRENHPREWMKKNADEVRRSVKIRQVVGTKDPTRMENQPFDELLTQLQIPHEYESVPDIGHNPRLYYEQVGEKGFLFHASAFAAAQKSTSEKTTKQP
jgi:endo-1,4-beta-xylanase